MRRQARITSSTARTPTEPQYGGAEMNKFTFMSVNVDVHTSGNGQHSTQRDQENFYAQHDILDMVA
jgi:hypothetical protein